MLNNMNTLDFILKRYTVTPASVIRIRNSRDWEMPRLFNDLKLNLGVEIGVAEGLFSEKLCIQNKNLKLYLVDMWAQYPGYEDESVEIQEKNYKEIKERIKSFNCHIIKDWSINAAKRFSDNSLDFVFIDANHTYEGCKEDIKAWEKKVKKGGIVSGHDYKKELNYGVIEAVDEWVKKNNISPLFLFTKDRCVTWFYIKT
jgi:hypothetical protein